MLYRGDNKFDVIIIGCGPAGASLGYKLKKEGYKVLVIQDRKNHGKNKVCSGIITKKTYNLLKEIYDIKALEKYSMIGIYNSFNIKDLYKATINDVELRVVNRRRFDIFLANQYTNACGDLIEEPEAFEINLNKKTVKVGIQKYEYTYLVGADGVFSYVRYLMTQKPQDRYLCAQIYTDPSPNEITFNFFSEDIEQAFGWSIGTSTRTHIGYANFSGEKRIDNHFKKHLKNYGIKKNYEIQRAYRPTGMDIKLTSKHFKNVFLVGDAAGLISPLTGEGIYYALLSSKMVFKAITNKKNYETLMKPTIENIEEQLLYKRHMHNFILRNIDLFIMSKNFKLSKRKKLKLKKRLNLY